jgi:error-prone DNA polymerase
VGWFNGPPSWAEMERVLDSKPRHAGESAGPEQEAPLSRRRATYQPPDDGRPSRSSVAYAELHAHSAFSFLDGASTPEELVEEAARLDLRALALTDHDGLYGAVRFAEAAAELDMRTVFGAELSLGPGARTEQPDPPGPHLLVLARGAEGYRRLSRQLAAAHLAGGEKGKPRYDFDALTEAAGGHWHILTGCRKGHVGQALSEGGPPAAERALAELVDRFGAGRVSIELTHHGQPLDDERNAVLAALAPRFGIGAVATTGAHFAGPSRRRLAMAMGAIRARESLDSAAGWLAPLGGSHLRSGEEMARLFAQRPDVVTAAAELGEQCAFGLALIAPQLPPFDVPAGHTEDSWLRQLTIAGARERYGSAESAPRAYSQIEHELKVIAQLTFPGYFLVVHDIARFCRENNILCQGRGSAANSAVCYALGVTAVDPVANELLFERFLSPARDGPPDIDMDIESDQREKSSSTSTTSTAATTPPRSPTSSPTGERSRCATWLAPLASRRGSRMRGASRSATGAVLPIRQM